jgi:EAL domain-containing protein (putative c-di-GMP-specific phosphodiesterase class I)
VVASLPVNSSDGAAARTQERTGRVLEIVQGGIKPAYQPIVDLSTREPIGYEALARFPSTPERGPDYWFGEAAAVGLGPDMELEAARVALLRLPMIPRDQFLAVNFTSAGVIDPRAVPLLESVDVSRIVVELTEHTPFEDYPHLLAALGPLRDKGLRLAVDDAGAGYSGLRHLLAVRPHIIKLDMLLTRGIDFDGDRRALAEALIAFGRSTKTLLVAEGVETPAEADTLMSIGVQYGQGFLLGVPAPLPDMADSRLG